MGGRPSRGLLDALRTTVNQLGKNTDLAPDDPVLIQLKQILLRRIADLQVTMESSPVSMDVPPAPEDPLVILQSPATEPSPKIRSGPGESEAA